jgi:hypothetical protein
VLAKLAFNENWGILLGGEMAIQRSDTSDQMFKGNGDTLVVLKHRIPTAMENTALGFELGYKVPSASTDVGGSGQTDYSFNGILSTKILAHDVDVNLGVTQVGGVSTGIDPNMYNWAVTVGRSLTDSWGAFVEVSGTQQSGTHSKSQMLAGISYTMNKRIVFDAGAARGMTAASPESILFAGATVLIGKIW